MNFVYLWSEDDSSESVIEEVPNGVAAAMDGVLGVEVATDTSPLRVSVELISSLRRWSWLRVRMSWR